MSNLKRAYKLIAVTALSRHSVLERRLCAPAQQDARAVAEHFVLIAEDEWLIAALIEDALIDAGYQVQLAVNGDKAAEQLSNFPNKFDILLTDIRMPGSMNGWDLARRAREAVADLPVIYMTGDSFAAWKQEGVSGSLMFQKPVSTQSLINAIGSFVALTSPG